MAEPDVGKLENALKVAGIAQMATAAAIVPLTSANEAIKKVANAIAGM